MTFQELDRTIFEAIRLKVVEFGYLPDITNYSTQEDYRIAKETLLNSMSGNDAQLIEIYGTAPSEKRDEKQTSMIVIDRKATSDGDFGAHGIVEYSNNGDGTFNKMQLPSRSEMVMYEIRIFTSSMKWERICQDILYKSLGSRKHLIGVETSESIEIERDGMVNLSATRLIEILIRYTVINVFLEDCTILSENIVPLTEVIT